MKPPVDAPDVERSPTGDVDVEHGERMLEFLGTAADEPGRWPVDDDGIPGCHLT